MRFIEHELTVELVVEKRGHKALLRSRVTTRTIGFFGNNELSEVGVVVTIRALVSDCGIESICAEEELGARTMAA